jgi:hypothetical protein
MPSPFPAAPTLSPQLTLNPYLMPPMPIRRTRGKYYVAAFLTLLVGAGGYFLVAPRSGVLELSVKPQDARLTVDGAAIAGRPPYRIEKRAGIHRLAISRPGYDPFTRDFQITARQDGHLDVVLAPAVDTGLRLTSTPQGALVWLDGQPLVVDRYGKQATTDFLATRVAPGPHAIELKGLAGFQPWQGQFDQEAGKTVVVHAQLAPEPGVAGEPSASRSSARVARSRPVSAGHDHIAHGARGGAGSVPQAQPASTEDIFEHYGEGASGVANCVATISSRPWAELLIDGKTTGKLTPLVNYPLPCGSHRLTFKNEDLMIERNERVTLVPGRPFKKIFQLVGEEL